ncbi:hypothetical protein ON058_08435 [Demequina sp. B12]|uniref:hypothetical protein n=1 Tax=Demequina sp. B12 TaxID=2992757 RepID=UPI00237C0C46|nr:hypothetical protein [Demequina sp. B12]MDE0573442.1 hypothetical protein [Demequina sp. B12]
MSAVNPVRPMLWRMAAAFVVATIGLSMVFWALDEVVAKRAAGDASGTPLSTYALIFSGLLLSFACWRYARSRWATHLAENPDSRPAPRWLWFPVAGVGAVGFVWGTVLHSSWLAQQDPAPLEPNLGFVLFQVLCVTLVLSASVALMKRPLR